MQVLAHDPEVAELNMSIFTSPAQSGTLSGSAVEVKPRPHKDLVNWGCP